MTENIDVINDKYRQKPKVAVYVCHCGGNISDVVDVKRVVQELSKYHDVVVARDYAFMCSSTGQSIIEEDIKNNGINKIVVAACAPQLHELTFREVLARAGLNPYLYEHVNIREQVSWVHKHDKEGATKKAISLIKAGVEKILRQDPLNPIRVNAIKRVAVIGGGISGMRASITCAENGLEVCLIEKTDKLGGNLNRKGYVYPSGEKAIDIVERFQKEVFSNPKIKVYLNTQITSISGYIGNFQINIESDKWNGKVEAGVIIIATGFQHYQPFDGEYGWMNSKFIVTLPQFIEILEISKGSDFKYEGKNIKSVAFIHCVGSRQIDGIDKPQKDGKVNEYCSRICCTAAIYTMNKMKEKFPNVNVYSIYTDIRTYGMNEKYYEQASKNDVIFFRRPIEERPQVLVNDFNITVKTRDILTFNEEIEMDVDMIVLVTGMMPSDISDLVEHMKIARSTNRFLQEVHPKLKPVEVANYGIFIAGTSQGPMDIVESIQAANTAAAKAVILLSKPDIPLDPYVAVVDEDRCNGCELCTYECSYDGALTMIEKTVDGKKKKIAYVNAALCKGCGACVAVCQPRAIRLNGWDLKQFEAMVDAIAKE